MSLIQAIIQVGPHSQTTKWQQNLFPNPHLFSKWIVLPTSCCYELDDTLVHCQGCHFPDSMKFPYFSRPRLGSTVSPRPKFSKLGSSIWLKINFRQQNPDFWNFVTNSLTFQGFPGQSQPCTVELTANVRNLAWIMWMDWNKYLINGAVICYEYFKYLTLKIITGNTQKFVLGDKNDFCNYIFALFCH